MRCAGVFNPSRPVLDAAGSATTATTIRAVRDMRIIVFDDVAGVRAMG